MGKTSKFSHGAWDRRKESLIVRFGASAANRKLASTLFFGKHERAREAPLEHADDEIALHVHCWYSLMVIFSRPKFELEVAAVEAG